MDVKKEILSALRLQDGYLSGQELCERFQVSRTAIWKHIRQLQEEGYEIEAVKNRGYRMLGSPDLMTAQEIESRLNTNWAGHPVEYLPTISSTNQYVRRRAEEGAPEGLLAVADEQTQGKGRSGRTWLTGAGTTIAMTLLLRPRFEPDRISMVTLVMGLAITDACRELYGIDAGIKWPNDVVVDGKKISGTLTEMSAEMMAVNYIVIGVGINVNITDFPEELRDRATSIAILLGKRTDRAPLAAKTIDYFEKYYGTFLQTKDLSLLKEHYNELLLNRNRAVRVLEPGHEYTGISQGINDRGELLVTDEEGNCRQVYAGEVSVRGVYGYV